MSGGANTLSAYGIRAPLPTGWEGQFTLLKPQPPNPQAVLNPAMSEVTNPFLHLGNFPLPPNRGAFGTGAVETMNAGNVFMSLLEYSSESVGKALFAPQGLPRGLNPGQFSPNALQRIIPGQGGFQAFFTEAGRAFSLYVVLGGLSQAGTILSQVNQILDGISVSSIGGI